MRKALAATGVVMILVLGLLFAARPEGDLGRSSGQGTNLDEEWRAEAVPNPPGTDLLGVSCRSPIFCVAVGLRTALGAGGAFVLGWDGSHWEQENLPRLPQSTKPGQPSGLIGISCPSTTYCMAVGPYVPYQAQPIGIRWDGARWELALPKRTGWLFRLIGLSCKDSGFCMAVGRAPRGPFQCTPGKCSGKTSETVVERWDGRQWHIEPAPTPLGALDLYGVSCTSRSFCIAVGSGAFGAIALRWDGSLWRAQRPANRGSEGKSATAQGLRGVSCVSPRYCMAVGDVLQKSATGLIERWDGASWRALPTPAMAGGMAADFTSVSCVSRHYCVAVGATAGPKENAAKPLVEGWDGATWTIEATTPPPGQSALYSVSCSAPGNCFAVGAFSANDTSHALIERLMRN